MSTFGLTKFGDGTMFGTEFIDPPIPILEVAWTKDIYHLWQFSGAAEGPIMSIFADAGKSYNLAAGSDTLEVDDTGKIEVTILNLDKKYTWSNKNSTLYPNVVAGKRFRLRARYGTTITFISIGTITDIVDFSDDLGRTCVRMEGQNDWRMLRDAKRGVTTALMTSSYAHDIIWQILSNINWPNGVDLETSPDMYGYWWADGSSAASLINEIANTELGNCYITADGTLVFRNRYNIPPPSYYITSSKINVDTLVTSKPTDNVRNHVSVVTHPFLTVAGVTLFDLISTIQLDEPTGDNPTAEIWGDLTYNGQKVTATGIVFTCSGNTAADGSGTDISAYLSAELGVFGTRFKMILTNTYIGVMWGTFSITGDALAQGSPITFQKIDADSQYEQAEFTLDSRWMQSINLARQIMLDLFNYLRIPQLVHSFELTPDDYSLMLSMDLGNRMSIDALENEIYGAYKVIRVTHNYDASSAKIWTTQVSVEPVDAEVVGGGGGGGGYTTGGTSIPVVVPFIIGG